MTERTPSEKTIRLLIGVLAEFRAGADCQDLRLRFQQIADRKASTFYACLHLARANGWVVQDADGIYSLSLNGNWQDVLKPPPIEEELGVSPALKYALTMRSERIEKLESINRRLTSSRKAIAAGNSAAPAIAALVGIMSDPTISTGKRISAAQSLLEYKSPQDVADGAKAFLASVFADPEMNVDLRLAATTALRRSEDVRIMPPIERPPPVARTDEPAPIPLDQLIKQRRERS